MEVAALQAALPLVHPPEGCVASKRRIGREDSETRRLLLDVTQRLMREEGYAAVSSRRVAALAGVKPPLVHYYFRTMDDLFLAVFRRGAEANFERQARALASPDPLRALWGAISDPTETALTLEFTALARHREVVRDEIALYAERFRTAQVEALRALLAERGVDPEGLPAVGLAVLMESVANVLVMEEALGITTGHAETMALVERFLERLVTPPARSGRRASLGAAEPPA
jgi:AcrR family transcriptional regulator